jgi:hypothetical protein
MHGPLDFKIRSLAGPSLSLVMIQKIFVGFIVILVFIPVAG